MFGELAMFRGEPRSATAECVEDTGAVALLARDVQRLIRQNPDIAIKLLHALADRVGRTTERLLQQSFQTVAGRVASALFAQVVARQGRARPTATCWCAPPRPRSRSSPAPRARAPAASSPRSSARAW